MNCALGIHAFDGHDMAELGIGCGLWEIGRVWVRARVVADEMEMLSSRGGDAE